MKKTSLIFLLTLFLIGCGGGGDGDAGGTTSAESSNGSGNSSDVTNSAGNNNNGNNINDSESSLPTTNANGIWDGTVTENGSQAQQFTGLLYDGTIVALSTERDTLYKGTYTVDGDDISGTVTIYSIGGDAIGTATITGVVTPRSQISLTYNTSYGTTGSVSIFYDDIYERNSSLETIAGNYTIAQADYTLKVSVQANGSYSGSDTAGCEIEGQVSILDPDFNLYDVTATVTLCGAADGDYTGFVSLSDSDSGVNDVLTVILSK